MFDKLEDLLIRFEEIMGELQEPDVVNDQARFRSLMKEQNDLVPIVEAYKEYKTCNETIDDSLSMLEDDAGAFKGGTFRRQKTPGGAGA